MLDGIWSVETRNLYINKIVVKCAELLFPISKGKLYNVKIRQLTLLWKSNFKRSKKPRHRSNSRHSISRARRCPKTLEDVVH